MKKLIDLFAKNGSRTAMNATRLENGWLPNDKPPAEEWNWYEYERNKDANENSEALQTALGGIDPNRLTGLDSRRVPVIRPNSFVGQDATYMISGSFFNLGINTVDTTALYDFSIGFDPSIKKPIAVASGGNSIASSGDMEAQLTFWPCWTYDLNPIVSPPAPRTINFGTLQVEPLADDFPVLVCDGYLYVVVAEIGTYGDRFIFQYDLDNWTGYPIASLELGSGQSFANCLCTELIEANDTQLAIGFKNKSFNQIRFLIIEKDLSSRTISLPQLGFDVMHRWLRSDGENLHLGGLDSTGADPHILTYDISADTITKTMFTGGSQFRIVDFMPICYDPSMMDLQAGWALTFDTSNTVPPRMWPYGKYPTTLTFSTNYAEIEAGETNLATDYHGSFCQWGSDLYVSFQKDIAAKSFGLYKRLDMTTVARTLLYATHSFAPAEHLGHDLGSWFQSTYAEECFTTKLVHDGRDMWWVDYEQGVFTRIVGPRK